MYNVFNNTYNAEAVVRAARGRLDDERLADAILSNSSSTCLYENKSAFVNVP